MKEVQVKNNFLTLRQNKPGDAAQSYTAIQESIRELSPYMQWCHTDYSIEDQKKWLELCVNNWDKRNEYIMRNRLLLHGKSHDEVIF